MRLLISHISHNSRGRKRMETSESPHNRHKASRFLHLLSPILNVPIVHKTHWLCPSCPHKTQCPAAVDTGAAELTGDQEAWCRALLCNCFGWWEALPWLLPRQCTHPGTEVAPQGAEPQWDGVPVPVALYPAHIPPTLTK